MTARALVIGGTGPTGPFVVEGLAERGFRVTILHGGQHEVAFAVPDVEHIHEDPHFAETLARGIGDRTFDLVVAQYGRLAVIADFFAGRTGRVIGIGAATGIYALNGDPRWGALGRPASFPDTTTLFIDSPETDKLKFRMAQSFHRLMEHDAAGDYSATYLGYPNNYGPRQPGPQDWCVLRRLLDGRGRLVIADGGIRMESRIASRNAAAAVLSVVDHPDVAGGKRYSASDQNAYTMRQRIELMMDHLGATAELVDMPFDVAWPCHPFWRHEREHRLCQSDLIRRELGYEDVVTTEEGLRESFDWLAAHRPEPDGEAERQIGDPFDYGREDELMNRWLTARVDLGDIQSPLAPKTHRYRHPKKPGEIWAAPIQSSPV
jgi:nucleoside-diphosphate-sugar epimerase